jgi:prolyl-tRNA editing enzyme YbaK/EbsC (Cys-tRNA(Pro) deacylase)
MGVPAYKKDSIVPLTQTVTLAIANTQYSITLPDGTKRFSMQPRTNADVRFAFETGKVAGSVEPFATMKSGSPYTEWDVETNTIIYFASGTAGTIVEIVYWI